jgi:uncharacterized metal-binding protein YceD (DUF177 family)
VEAIRDNLIFSLDRWPEAGVQTEFALAPSTLAPYLEAAVAGDGDLDAGEAPLLLSDFKGSLDLQLYGSRLRIRGAFSVNAELTCHRCLAPFEERLADNFDEAVDLIARSEESEDLEAKVSIADNKFDLAPLMCEFFWLAWPMKVLCRPDCQGLCLSCGANLNEGLCSCGAPVMVRH